MPYIFSHHWPLDEAIGNVALDHVFPSISGTLHNATRITPGRWSFGAVHLDGSDNSYIDFTNAVGQFGTADFTVALWFRTSDVAPLSDMIGNRTVPSGGNFFSIRMAGNGFISAALDQDSSGANYLEVKSDVGGLNDGHWHYLAVTRKKRALTLYVDSRLAGSGQSSGITNINNQNPFKLGRSLIMSGASKCSLIADYDDVSIFDAALTLWDITQLAAGQYLVNIPDVLDTNSGYIETANHAYISAAADGTLNANRQGTAALFTFTRLASSPAVYLKTNNKWITVRADSRLVATAPNIDGASIFIPYLSGDGNVILYAGLGRCWQLGDHLEIMVSGNGRVRPTHNMGISFQPVQPNAILTGLDVGSVDFDSPCDLAWAAFVGQVTGGLFLALGLGPFITSGQVQTGLLGLLRNNSQAWQLVLDAYNTIKAHPEQVSVACLALVSGLWRIRMLWPVISFGLTTAGWWAVGKVLATIFGLALAPEVEAAELLASFTVWAAQTVLRAQQVSTACP